VTSAAPRVTGTFVRVDPAAHVGSSVAEVHAWLIGLDLRVALVAVERADVPTGQVLALAPTGEVPVGTTVTVTHAVPPPPPPPPAPAPTAAPTAGPGNDDGDRGKDKEKDGDRGRGRDKDDD
jgi:serine/threonine-protein kinase